MARDNTWENDEFEEVTLEYLLTFTREYLAKGLLKCVKYMQDDITATKALKKETSYWKSKMRTCKDLVKIYALKAMILRMRKLFGKQVSWFSQVSLETY